MELSSSPSFKEFHQHISAPTGSRFHLGQEEFPRAPIAAATTSSHFWRSYCC
ncbi:hypothetical protein DEO72_LG8g2462 [Vigna unguiculata]|uniref:Uncharacterized protein n=1 Tax=Vigna unguiculata TaxID=3917 RepID=A0A4D6MSI4_VIGUN|nr:hypothetical protein DEO72_LG8g2462 [Vigna unguiculata]